jgi:hypothetical protein
MEEFNLIKKTLAKLKLNQMIGGKHHGKVEIISNDSW